MPNDSQTAAAIQAWLVSHLVEQFGIAPQEIDLYAPFDSYGLDSMIMVSLTGELEDWLGYQLSPNLLYEYTTIVALSQYLATEVTELRST
jgi:acyl carrier protein